MDYNLYYFYLFQMMMSAPTRQIPTSGPDELVSYEPPPTPGDMGYKHKKFKRADSVRK